MRAVSCVWGTGATAAAERIHRHCHEAQWELVACVVRSAVGDGTLGVIVGAAACAGADCLILTHEGLDELEHHLPELWERVRTCLEHGRVAVVAV